MSKQENEASDHKLGTLYEIGLKHFQAREYRKCVDLWNGALRFDSQNYRALTFLALAHEQLGELDACKQCLEEAVQIAPDYPKAWNNLGNVHRKTGELFRAEECYRNAIEHSPGSADYRYNLAITFLDTLQYQEAIREFLYYRRLRPNDDEVLVPMAGAYYQVANNEKALQCLRVYLKARPATQRFAQLRAQMRVIRTSLEDQGEPAPPGPAQ